MKVSQHFADDFDLVVRHYALPPHEIEEAKDAARRDLPNAEMSFAAMANQIRYQNTKGQASPC